MFATQDLSESVAAFDRSAARKTLMDHDRLIHQPTARTNCSVDGRDLICGLILKERLAAQLRRFVLTAQSSEPSVFI
jgi:hypothetical protein